MIGIDNQRSGPRGHCRRRAASGARPPAPCAPADETNPAFINPGRRRGIRLGSSRRVPMPRHVIVDILRAMIESAALRVR